MAYTRYTSAQKEAHARSGSNCDLQLHHVSCYDHISSGYSKQDSPAIMSDVEALCMRLKKDFPYIKQFYVQSDNAKCCKTPKLVFA